MSVLLRAYRALLRLCPADFREQFGHDMVLNVRDQLEAEASIARRGLVVARAAGDVARTACAEHVGKWRASRRPSSARRAEPLSSTVQDLSFALRSLRRRPFFAAGVIVTLALGIGANTAVFSVIDGVLLHPLPVADPSRLLAIYQATRAEYPHGYAAYPAFRAMQTRSHAFAGIAGFNTIDVTVDAAGQINQTTVATVSGNYFELLGVQPSAGRLLIPSDDDAIGAHHVVVLSDGLWQSAFHRSASAIGAVVHVGKSSFTVVGIAPSTFRGTELDKSPKLWVPITMTTSVGEGGLYSNAFAFTTYAFGWVHLVGRLRDGIEAPRATNELNAMVQQLSSETASAGNAFPLAVKSPMSVVPVVSAATLTDRESLVRFVMLLLLVVTLTLLIACINVANLMHVRGAERARELGIRAALGAGRGRIARQLLLESLVLAIAGATVGCAIALVAMRLLARFTLPGGIALADVGLRLDARVLAFTATLGVSTALFFGISPSIRASRVALGGMLRLTGTPVRSKRHVLLIAAQIAMSVVLLVGAALFSRSVAAGLKTDIGFDPSSLAAISFVPRQIGYDEVRALQLYDDAIAAAERAPGVRSAAVTTHVPLGNMLKLPFTPAGDDSPQAKVPAVSSGFTSVSTGYFGVLGVPLLAGRMFTDGDDGHAGKVVILNEAASSAMFHGRSAIGATIKLLRTSYTVVGIVRDTKYESVRDDHVPVVFAPIKDEPDIGGVTLVMRSADRAAAVAAARRELTRLAPGMPLHDGRFVADQIDAVIMPQRFGATLFGIFAMVALCVSATGIFGVIAFSVAQRAQEIGIRIALGAQTFDVHVVVLRGVAAATAIGLVVGTLGAAAAGKALRQFLFGVTPLDVPAFAAAIAMLIIAAGLAAWIPARRAARVDPMIAMKTE